MSGRFNVSVSVSCCAPLVMSVGCQKRFELALRPRFDEKTIRRPSGDHIGDSLLPAPTVCRCWRSAFQS